MVPVASATMTPLPLLLALCIQKVRGWLGFRTEGRCPVAVTAGDLPDDKETAFKCSESSQKLMNQEALDDEKETTPPRVCMRP